MVIVIIDNIGVTIHKFKEYTPIAGYFYCMKALFIATQLVEKRTWVIHIFYFTDNFIKEETVFSSPYVSSKTSATDPPQRVQMPLSTSIPFSIFPLTLPMPVISEQLTHHTLFNIFIRISPGMAFQIFRAWGFNENSTEDAAFWPVH
jgi:hypothetical protein